MSWLMKKWNISQSRNQCFSNNCLNSSKDTFPSPSLSIFLSNFSCLFFGSLLKKQTRSLNYFTTKRERPGELQELLSVHEAAVVLVDGPEGGAGLVLLAGDHWRGPRARTRPPTLIPSRLLKIILHTATTFSKGHKVFPRKTRMKSVRLH